MRKNTCSEGAQKGHTVFNAFPPRRRLHCIAQVVHSHRSNCGVDALRARTRFMRQRRGSHSTAKKSSIANTEAVR